MSSLIANAKTNMTSVFADAKTNMGSNTITIALTVMATALIIYLMYHVYTILKKTDLKTVTFLKTAKKINSGAIDTLNSSVDMPLLHNGTEFSYSFWMYVNDFVPTGSPKLVLFNGKNNNSITDATPIFYMDPEYVSLHVLLKTNLPTQQLRRNLNDLHTLKDCDYVRMNVPYVPMNRWVNVTLVVDNQFAQLFFDGELRKVIDINESRLIENKGWVDDSKDGCTSPACCDTNNICCNKTTLSKNLGTFLSTGKLVGGSNEVLDGYLSQVRFFNYAITIDHAKVIYQTGPIHQSILSNVGVPMYGIRNPFYDLNKVEESCSASNVASTS